MQQKQREYSAYEGSQWLNQKVITCAIKLWPVVVVDGSMLRCRGVFVRDLLEKLGRAIFCNVRLFSSG